MKKNNKDKTLKGLRYKINENGIGTLEVDEERLSHCDFSLKVESLPIIFVSLNEYLGYPQDKLPWDKWKIDAWIEGEDVEEIDLNIVKFVDKYKDYYIKAWERYDIEEDSYQFTLTKDLVVWEEENKFFHSFQDKKTKLVYITPKWEVKLKKHRKKKEIK